MSQVFENFSIESKVNNGASSVEKYKIIKDGKIFLLRLFDPRFMSNRYIAIEKMKYLYEHGISVPKIYEYGMLNDINKGYVILDWIEGYSLSSIIKNADIENRYGIIVADELKKMHSLVVESDVNTYNDFIESFQKKVAKVEALNINSEFLKLFQDYISKNVKLLKRLDNQCIIHGDFHPGNIVIGTNKKITFIDMDVCKIDNPWADLTSNVCNMEFPNFYSSTIKRYFNDKIPLDFWTFYKLYGCLYCLEYLLYANRISDKEITINDGIKRVVEFIEFTEYLENIEPTWFNNKKKKEIKWKI